MGIQRKELGVYVHIPFCSSKCPYCDFNSAALDSIPEARYVGALRAELKGCKELDSTDAYRLSSIYFGGGTPSTLSPASIEEIIGLVRGSFYPSSNAVTPEVTPEITIEANPESVDRARLEGFRRAGANRLSIGVQSFDTETLKTLGRAHSAGRARTAFTGAREAGFDNIGIDLIFAVPGQSLKSWAETLAEAVALRPEHISLYNLTIEASTPFYELYPSADAAVPEELSNRMYGLAVEILKGAGYLHYEISNFALAGCESVHNTGYWSGRGYIGLGAGAHSYRASPGWGLRSWNERVLERYMSLAEAGEGAITGSEELSKAEARSEGVMLGLRMLERGIDAGEFERRFGGLEASEGWRGLAEEGYVRRRSGALLLTPKGVLLSDSVIAALVG